MRQTLCRVTLNFSRFGGFAHLFELKDNCQSATIRVFLSVPPGVKKFGSQKTILTSNIIRAKLLIQPFGGLYPGYSGFARF